MYQQLPPLFYLDEYTNVIQYFNGAKLNSGRS